jgi:hypothetical protein
MRDFKMYTPARETDLSEVESLYIYERLSLQNCTDK